VGPEWIFVAVILLVVLLVISTGLSSRRGGGSTAGHYDPDAIGGYTLDPATMRYRYDLPTLPRSSGSMPPGEGPPHRRRKRRRRPPDPAGG
jgi:hypothetical protein